MIGAVSVEGDGAGDGVQDQRPQVFDLVELGGRQGNMIATSGRGDRHTSIYVPWRTAPLPASLALPGADKIPGSYVVRDVAPYP
jgi:hypothetical protein